MGTSWGHKARLLTEQERADRERMGCARRGCTEKPTVMVSYRYSVGRTGREAGNHSPVCQLHGKKFTARYGIEIAPAPATRLARPVGGVQRRIGAAGGDRR